MQGYTLRPLTVWGGALRSPEKVLIMHVPRRLGILFRAPPAYHRIVLLTHANRRPVMTARFIIQYAVVIAMLAACANRGPLHR